MKIKFLGAAGTVTGSKYLVEHDGYRLLVDCGLFQGLKDLRRRNREPLPVPPENIDCVLLTHAHIDHSGYLPLLIKSGFKGPVYCTQGTLSLCEILLPDSGKLQEEEANLANRRGYSKHRPAEPLYTCEEAEKALRSFRPLEWDTPQKLNSHIRFQFSRAGHILGAAFLRLEIDGKKIVFSGDLGRDSDPVLLPPDTVEQADYLVLESTYGGRQHSKTDLLLELESVINRTVKRGGVVVVPAFSVGRTQTLLYCLSVLKKDRRIPAVPIYLNSPMSVRATQILGEYPEEQRLSHEQRKRALEIAETVAGELESTQLNLKTGPMIILSASGMATGGRVLHHLKAFGPDEKNTILFTGFQAEGTRGALLVAGKKEIKIHGELVSIRAEVLNLDGFSAHADESEILEWLSHFKSPPKVTFLTHGEAAAAAALKKRIELKPGWHCQVPKYLDEVGL